MFNYNVDSWGKKEEKLEEGDLDDIIIEEKPKKSPKPKKAKKPQRKPESIEIESQLESLEYQILKEIFIAYKSQYQHHPNAIERFRLLLKKLGIEYKDLKPHKRR